MMKLESKLARSVAVTGQTVVVFSLKLRFEKSLHTTNNVNGKNDFIEDYVYSVSNSFGGLVYPLSTPCTSQCI